MVQENVVTSHKYVCVQFSYFTQKTRRNLSPLEFRSTLISQLVEKYGYDTEAVRKGGRASTGGNPFRSVEQHFSSYVPATEKKFKCYT